MKWHKNPTLAQARKYRNYDRKRKLRREIKRFLKGERDTIPQPRKPAPWLVDMYKTWNVDNGVALPKSDLSDADNAQLISIQRKVRALAKDILPADATKRDVTMYVLNHGKELTRMVLNNYKPEKRI